MTRVGGRTQTCGAADARTRQAQARKFLEVAELVADEDIDAPHSVAAPQAVLVGLVWALVLAVIWHRRRGSQVQDGPCRIMAGTSSMTVPSAVGP